MNQESSQNNFPLIEFSIDSGDVQKDNYLLFQFLDDCIILRENHIPYNFSISSGSIHILFEILLEISQNPMVATIAGAVIATITQRCIQNRKSIRIIKKNKSWNKGGSKNIKKQLKEANQKLKSVKEEMKNVEQTLSDLNQGVNMPKKRRNKVK